MKSLTKVLGVVLIGTFALLSGCKTTEQIRQEKRVDDLANLSADYDGRLQNLETSLQKLQGQLEETEHHLQAYGQEEQNSTQKNLELLQAQFKALQEVQQEQSKTLQEIKTQLAAQQKYIGEVAQALSTYGPSPKGKNSWQSNYDLGQKYFKENKYQKALPLLQPLVQEKAVTGDKRASLLYSLGMIEYANKNNTQAIYYLGTLYQEFPKSNYNQNGLLVLGKTFKRQGQNEKALATWEELQSSFPKSKKASAAASEIAKLPK